jgi:hypothetical protein
MQLTNISHYNIETGDIVSGVPEVVSLMEIRTKKGILLILNGLYKYFWEKSNSNRIAARKTIHFRQRIRVDRIVRIYQTNGVTIRDKHLELILRPRGFVKIIHISGNKNFIVEHERYLIDFVERIIWSDLLNAWRIKEILNFQKPIMLCIPILYGLTNRTLKSFSFLSAASFQQTSSVLINAAFTGERDYILGLKENLIICSYLPIGTDGRFFQINRAKHYVKKHRKIQPSYFNQTTITVAKSLSLLDILYSIARSIHL